MSCSCSHEYSGYLILCLNDDYVVILLVVFQIFALVSCRGDWIICLESAPGLELGDSHSLYASDQHQLLICWARVKFVGEAILECFLHVIVTVFCGFDVEVSECCLSPCETFLDRFTDFLEVVID